jgi:hypothetical protein
MARRVLVDIPKYREIAPALSTLGGRGCVGHQTLRAVMPGTSDAVSLFQRWLGMIGSRGLPSVDGGGATIQMRPLRLSTAPAAHPIIDELPIAKISLSAPSRATNRSALRLFVRGKAGVGRRAKAYDEAPEGFRLGGVRRVRRFQCG